MAARKTKVGGEVPAKLVEFFLLGPSDDRRQLQDSPILGDVWLAFAADPSSLQDLLITPHRDQPAARLAKSVSNRIAAARKAAKRREPAAVAYVQAVVAAKVHFDEVVRLLVPMTVWWRGRAVTRALATPDEKRLSDRIRSLIELSRATSAARTSRTALATYDTFTALERYLALAAILSLAAKRTRAGRAARNVDAIVKEALALLAGVHGPGARTDEAPLIFPVSLNRPAMPALDRSVPAVKADAARTVFSVDCSKITWAVMDAGIAHAHPAFATAKGGTRVKRTYDFTCIRDILSSDSLEQKLLNPALGALLANIDLPTADAHARLRELADDADQGRPRDWDKVEELIMPKVPPAPSSPHGTHVAGIIGAAADNEAKQDGNASGMCPDICLYDFRVLAKTVEDTEFAIIAALQFARFINEQRAHVVIHGVNLSVSIPHSVRNYACGRTPICIECERLVDSGVVVVAAAGNRGYHKYETTDGVYEGYAAFSITDPGNAEGVITVGATRAGWPHTCAPVGARSVLPETGLPPSAASTLGIFEALGTWD